MSYRNLLHQAWKTTWESKYLWFFGLFAVLLGNSGGFEVVFQLFNQQTDTGVFAGVSRYVETGFFSTMGVKSLGSFIVTDPLSFIMLMTVFLIFIVLGVFLLWLSVTSQAALVNNSARIATGKNHDFKKGLEAGIKNFWSVLGLNVALKVLMLFTVLLISLPVVLSIGLVSLTMTNLIFVLLFIIFVPAVVCISFVVKYAICYVVIKGNTVKEAVNHAWRLLVSNWLISLEMSLTLLVFNLLVSLALVLLFLILSIPLLFIAFMFARLTFMFTFWVVIFSSLIVFFLLIVFTGAALTTFQISAWTSLFIRLTGKGGKSMLVQLFEKKK